MLGFTGRSFYRRKKIHNEISLILSVIFEIMATRGNPFHLLTCIFLDCEIPKSWTTLNIFVTENTYLSFGSG